MNGPMERIARHITGQDVSLPAMFKTLTAVIIIRTVVEKVLSSGHLLLYDPADHYECLVGDLHMYFSWVCIFLSMSVPVAAFLRIRYREAMKVTLVGFCITVSVPLLDYAWSLGKGDEIHYFRSFDTFLYNYVNLFNPLSKVEGVTAGVRAEVLTLFFGSFFFSWLGFRRSLARSFLLALTLYTIVYFYGYLLPLHHLAGIDLTTMAAGSTTRIEGSQSLFFAYLGPFLLSLLGVVLVLIGQKKGSGRMIVSLLYPSRLLFYLFLLCFGFLFAAQQTGAYPKILNLPDMLKAVCAAVSICLLFVHAKLDNDLNDDVIDSVSNPSRPIASGFIGKEDARGLSTVTMALSFVLAIPVERDFFYFWLFIWGFSYVYSVPPFRLKRFWPLGHIALSLIGTAVFMGGASIARPDDFYAGLKHREIILYIFTAFFFLCHLKDLKDVQGDRAGGVFNLFGHVGFPRRLGLLFLGAFLVQVCLIAHLIGVSLFPTLTAAGICAAVAAIYAVRVGTMVRLDRLLILSFLFLLYASGAWLVHLGM